MIPPFARLGNSLEPLTDLRPLDPRHADRPVFTGRWHDPISGDATRVVVKEFRGVDALVRADRLHRTTVALWCSSAGASRPTPAVPRPVAAGAVDPDRAVVVMEAVQGEVIATRGDLGRSVELAADCATLLADLHDATGVPEVLGSDHWAGIPVRPAARVLRSTQRKLAELPDDVAAAAAPLLASMRERSSAIEARGERLVVTHGDAAPRNVIASPSGVRLIDLDRVHLAGAGRDIAYWIAWARATAASGRPGQRVAADVLDHYLRRRIDNAVDRGADVVGVVGEVVGDLPFHLAAAFVRIVHGWSALRDDPTARARVLDVGRRLVAEFDDGAAATDLLAVDLVDREIPVADPGAGCRCGGGSSGESMPACGHGGGRGRTRV